MPETRRDAFLGGRLHVHQPVSGYRAGVDPVLLAATIPARAGEQVLDLGCGVGVAGLCVAQRVPGAAVAGLERHPAYAALARRNARENAADFTVFEGDLDRMPAELRARRFDHVLANPPYFRRDAGTAAADPAREVALGEQTPLAHWVEAASRRTRPGGTVTFIQRAARLPELLSVMAEQLGSIEALPLLPRGGRAPRLVIVRGRKGGRAEFCLHAGWILHAGERHEKDGENYTKATASVLRDAAPLPFPARVR
ncbi:methyltransferase [Roseovarius sp. SCSIO 43702]|uniref:tRNA1(Val) (adenine(37)-N6)-methyltransferase n=1 Tax=Roseovarius sp. SCSIO 43702 TaxID=2823043 RepID=UPI001C7399EA|nr:methyltransferase [Roseovarius sp. SCSIO 43702]QYX56375.1 methyltransferase [Roseovarius sp. SCSIO 43702]